GLFAVSYMAIYYSQEARAYIFVTLFSIWYFDSYLRVFLAENETRSSRYQFWASGFFLIYFHYVGVVLVIGSFVLLPLLAPVTKKRVVQWLKAYAAFLIMYSLWLPV